MIIYKVTNLKNNKVYIGQSTRSLKERRRYHYLEARRINDNTYFHNALNKYNPDDFKWEILEDNVIDQEELNKLEIQYIQQYQSFDKSKGYNLKLGGNGGGMNTDATKKKIGLKTKERWQNREIAKRMLEGLRKGTQTVKEQSVNYYIERICPCCNKTFKVKPSEKKKFCSKECQYKNYKTTNCGLSKARVVNQQILYEKRMNQINIIKKWVLNNSNLLCNVKMNRLSCIFEPLKQLLNVQDERSVSIVLGTQSRKEFVRKLLKMYAELIGNNKN